MTNTKQAAVYSDPTPEAYQQYGKELLNSGLYGFGAAGSLAAIYHLLNGMGSSKLPELLQNPVPAASTKVIKKKKPAARLGNKQAATKSANSLMQSFYESVGRLIPEQFIPSMPGHSPTATPSLGVAHGGWRQAANIAAAMAGGAGGIKLVNSMTAQKRKEDVEDEVERARKSYFDALTGKEAAALDSVYDNLFKNAGAENGNVASTFLSKLKDRVLGVPLATGEGLWTAGLLSALGTGSIGAKYMYDQTKARTRAENLQRAQASRARLRGLQQTPYVDPEELAAIAGR